MILWGSALYLWGWQVARLLFFPLFFLWLSIPVPEFQQATTRLQIIELLSERGSRPLPSPQSVRLAFSTGWDTAY